MAAIVETNKKRNKKGSFKLRIEEYIPAWRKLQLLTSTRNLLYVFQMDPFLVGLHILLCAQEAQMVKDQSLAMPP